MTARQCPERDLNWRRHAGSGQNEAMPVPSRRLKELIEGTVDHHASQRWPALEEVTISWRGSYGYLTGYLSEDDDDTIKLCRIQYLGDDTEWAFAIWQASTDSYAAPSSSTATAPGTPARPSIPPAPSISPAPATSQPNPSRTYAALH